MKKESFSRESFVDFFSVKMIVTVIVIVFSLSVFAKFPIILYHAHPNMSFTEEMFTGHLNFLYDEGFTTVTMDDFLDWYIDNAIMPLHPIVITFDDNYIDTYNIAYPALQGFGFIAINYVITNSVGNASPTIEYCDWDVLIEMEQNGVFYSESHAHTHPYLANLTEEQIRTELNLSKSILEEQKEKDIIHLAYPYGSYDQRVLDLMEEAGYVTGVTTISGFNYRNTPLLELRRIYTDGITVNQLKSRLEWADRQPTPTGEGWIIDNTETNFSVINGDWSSVNTTNAWANSYLYSSSGDGSGVVRWSAYLRDEGYFRLHVWIPRSVANTGTVSYTVHHEEGVTEVQVDQNQTQSDWHHLGGFYFNDSYPVKVTMNSSEQNVVVADALWIEPSEVTFVSDWHLF